MRVKEFFFFAKKITLFFPQIKGNEFSSFREFVFNKACFAFPD